MKLLLLILFIIPSVSFSFSLNNQIAAHFEQDKVLVNVADAGCNTALGLTSQELLDLVTPAVNNFWNTVPTSRLRLQTGSLVGTTSAFQTDTVCTGSGSLCIPNADLLVSSGILITCNTNLAGNFSNSNSVLAVSVPNNTLGDTIVGAIILINADGGNNFQNLTRDEKISTIAHEIGHAIGLGHSPVVDSLMYFETLSNRFYLGQDDFDGVTYLYPKKQPVGCGTIKYVDSPPSSKLLFTAALGFLLALGAARAQKTLMNS